MYPFIVVDANGIGHIRNSYAFGGNVLNVGSYIRMRVFLFLIAVFFFWFATSDGWPGAVFYSLIDCVGIALLIISWHMENEQKWG